MLESHNEFCNLFSGLVAYEYEREQEYKKAKEVKTLIIPMSKKVYQLLWIKEDRIFGYLMFPDKKARKTHRYMNINL